MSHFVLYVLPYFSVPIYLVMLAVRLWVWLRFYNPALVLLPGARGSVYQTWKRQYRPTINLFPRRSRTKGLEVRRTLKGFLLFSGLWKRDKALWVGSWPLHVGLGLVVLAHVWMIVLPGRGTDDFHELFGLAGSGVMTVSGAYLLLRRLVIKRVREITDLRDYLAEVILLFFSATASILLWNGGLDVAAMGAYAMGLVTFADVPLAGSPILIWHLLSVYLLLLIMPFSHLLHFGGIFLSREFLGSSDSFAGEFGEREISGD